MFNGADASWKSKRQSISTLSSAEAEFVAVSKFDYKFDAGGDPRSGAPGGVSGEACAFPTEAFVRKQLIVL
jgi:hypothetical protein